MRFVYEYDEDALEREYNIQKCKEMMTSVKFLKTVEQYYTLQCIC